MKQHKGFTIEVKKELFRKIRKSHYILKESTRMLYHKLNTHILGSMGFLRRKDDHNVYCKQVGKYFLYVVLYVNDRLLVGNNMKLIKEFKMQLSSRIYMKDINASNFILVMELKSNSVERKLQLYQRKFVETILHEFNMKEYKPIKVPITIGVRFSA